jgi:hypothetical protein
MSLCNLCGEDRPLVRAHIVPESMYPFERERRESLRMVASGPDTCLRRSRAGAYDRELVCGPCEAEFGPGTTTCRLLRTEPEEEDCVYVDGELRAYTIRTYYYAKLKLSFVSLLWRASESSRSFFAHVSVGPKHTARLKEMILNRDPGEPEEYAVFMVRLTHHRSAHRGVMSPKATLRRGLVLGVLSRRVHVRHEGRSPADPLAVA